ncbi:flocculation protein FLO11 [Hyalella azteca]|uniref:Flocculation protein FLO11 n=1 Tax=Hyalella azteca TaxID=294128 RepID=A0A979FH88_HYAAZ|nr:flocculation protein FLO11 [Hyalella azteca]
MALAYDQVITDANGVDGSERSSSCSSADASGSQQENGSRLNGHMNSPTVPTKTKGKSRNKNKNRRRNKKQRSESSSNSRTSSSPSQNSNAAVPVQNSVSSSVKSSTSPKKSTQNNASPAPEIVQISVVGTSSLTNIPSSSGSDPQKRTESPHKAPVPSVPKTPERAHSKNTASHTSEAAGAITTKRRTSGSSSLVVARPQVTAILPTMRKPAVVVNPFTSCSVVPENKVVSLSVDEAINDGGSSRHNPPTPAPWRGATAEGTVEMSEAQENATWPALKPVATPAVVPAETKSKKKNKQKNYTKTENRSLSRPSGADDATSSSSNEQPSSQNGPSEGTSSREGTSSLEGTSCREGTSSLEGTSSREGTYPREGTLPREATARTLLQTQ